MQNQPETIRIDLGPRAYDVLVGTRLLSEAGGLLLQRGLTGPVAILADANLISSYAPELQASLAASHLHSFLVEVPAGEGSKSLEAVARLHSELARHKVPRSGTILALGGGVIGDLAGFVAASYLRGVAFVQVPTTLLAMVDSSVGGKTGVNLPEGKNLVGAFHQPRLVLADLDTLATLPPREFSAGMAEVIKYGAIKDAELFERVAKGVKPTDPDLASIITKCIAIKARIVENDEFETKGERALLNFGHTIGHAIEKATGYKRYLHGEAIALGMRAAAWLSTQELNVTGLEIQKRIEGGLAANGLPIQLDDSVESESVLAALGNDKKVGVDGVNRWVLLPKIGEAISNQTILPSQVKTAVRTLAEKDMGGWISAEDL